MYYIYLITNNINDNLYVGMTKNHRNGDDRFKQHIRDLKGKRHRNKEWVEDFHKYQMELEEFILYSTPSLSQAEKIEMFFIDFYNSVHMGYNQSLGGKTNAGYKQSEYAKEVASKVHSQKLGEKNSFFGKMHSEKTKELISYKMKGRNKGVKRSEETRQKMKESNARAKPIVVNGEKYVSCTEALKFVKMGRTKLVKMANDPSVVNIYFE